MNEQEMAALEKSDEEAPQQIWDSEKGEWRIETYEEATTRVTLVREAKEKMEREQAAYELWRTKSEALKAGRDALSRYWRAWDRINPNFQATFGGTATEERLAEAQSECESALFEVQAMGDALHQLMPELFWPKGTPPAPEPLDDQLRMECRALRARLRQTLIRVEEILDTDEEEAIDGD